MDRPQRSLIEDEQLEMAKALLKEELQAKAAAGKMHQVDFGDALRKLEQQSFAEVTQTVKAPLYEELRIAATVAQTMDQATWYAKAEQLKNQPVVEILQARAAAQARQDTPPLAPERDRPVPLPEPKAPASPPRDPRVGATLSDRADMVSVQQDAMRRLRDQREARERQASTPVTEPDAALARSAVTNDRNRQAGHDDAVLEADGRTARMPDLPGEPGYGQGGIVYRNAQGQLHREDGPARIVEAYSEDYWGSTTSKTEWYARDGVLHREGGPARIVEEDKEYTEEYGGGFRRSKTEEYARDGVFHREDGPARIVEEQKEDRGDIAQSKTEWYVRDGIEMAEVRTVYGKDAEGSLYREEWFKDGQHHRDDGPAVIRQSIHDIPDETHLDASIEEWWTHGIKIREEDHTYEDIISHKPLSVRIAFGYDVDTPAGQALLDEREANRAAQAQRTPLQDTVPGQEGPPQARAGQEPTHMRAPAPDVPYGPDPLTLPPDLARYAISRERNRQPGRYDILKALPGISPQTRPEPPPQTHTPAARVPPSPPPPPPPASSAPMPETPAEQEAHAQVHLRRTQHERAGHVPGQGHTPETAAHTARLTPEVSNSAADAERARRRLILEKARQGRDPLNASEQRYASLEAAQQRSERHLERAAEESQEKVQRFTRVAEEEGARKTQGQERTPETAVERTERLTRESRGGKPLTEREKRSLILQEARERHGIPSPSPSQERGRTRDR